jgi:hypothetical protein
MHGYDATIHFCNMDYAEASKDQDRDGLLCCAAAGVLCLPGGIEASIFCCMVGGYICEERAQAAQHEAYRECRDGAQDAKSSCLRSARADLIECCLDHDCPDLW